MTLVCQPTTTTSQLQLRFDSKATLARWLDALQCIVLPDQPQSTSTLATLPIAASSTDNTVAVPTVYQAADYSHSACLQLLSYELLCAIFEYIVDAQTWLALCLTCKHIAAAASNAHVQAAARIRCLVNQFDANGEAQIHRLLQEAPTRDIERDLRYMIYCRADVNLREQRYGNTPLALVPDSHAHLARILIDARASPMAIRHSGATTLHVVAQKKSCDVLRILLKDTCKSHLTDESAAIARKALQYCITNGVSSCNAIQTAMTLHYIARAFDVTPSSIQQHVRANTGALATLDHSPHDPVQQYLTFCHQVALWNCYITDTAGLYVCLLILLRYGWNFAPLASKLATLTTRAPLINQYVVDVTRAPDMSFLPVSHANPLYDKYVRSVFIDWLREADAGQMPM
jgi:hypothetical protein